MSACLWTWDAWQDFGTAMNAVGLAVGTSGVCVA